MAVNPLNDEEFALLHSIHMTEEAFEQVISVPGPYRYELIDGLVYDMTGSSPEHADIAYNVTELLKGQLGKQGPCRVYQEQFVAVPNKPTVVPDVVVTCDIADRDKKRRLKPFKIRSPLIVVEILSPSTEDYDHNEKFARYRLCPTLEVYILVSQDESYVEVYRRANGWRKERYESDQIIKLDPLDLVLPLASIYEGVF